MRKSYAFIAVLTVLFIISCSGGVNTPPADPVEIDVSSAITSSSASATAVSAPIRVEGGNQEITLTGLESGRLYTIYADSSVSLMAAAKAGVQLTNLGNGTYSFILPEGVTEITFTAKEIGLQNGGEINNIEGTETYLDSPEAIEAMEYLFGLVQKGYMPAKRLFGKRTST